MRFKQIIKTTLISVVLLEVITSVVGSEVPRSSVDDKNRGLNIKYRVSNNLEDGAEEDNRAVCEKKSADVVIIGAGYAGIRAAVAIKEEAPDLSVVVLESSNRIGGRAITSKIGGYNVGLGPKWLNEGDSAKRTPTLDLFDEYGLNYVVDDALNMTAFTFSDACTTGKDTGRRLSNSSKLKKAYALLDRVKQDSVIDYSTKKRTVDFLETAIDRKLQNSCVVDQVSQEDIKNYHNRFQNQIMDCVIKKSKKAWANDDISYDDEQGALYEYINCGYDDTDSLEFLMKWFWHDFEFADATGSIYAVFDPWEVSGEAYYTVDGGYAPAIKKYAEENKIEPLFRHRVKSIRYNIRKEDSDVRAGVTVKTNKNKCIFYESQRVISTVSAGVYNNNLIKFKPKLRFNEKKFNPMKINRYLNIWYQFPTKFWEETANQTHWIYTLRNENYDGVSLNWQNLDREGMYPGSKILVLTLVEEGFVKVFGKKYRKEKLPTRKLMNLLKPLKVVFGDKYKKPIKTIYNRFHGDRDFGFGAYSHWDKGYSPYDYFKFWGGYDFGDYINPCNHNGCNGRPNKPNTEWILYLSGAASCLELYEWVHGAWYAGEMAAYLMMESLGIELDDWKGNHPCYES